MARTSSARERILDAFTELLISDGSRAATLDAAAAAAGVSKGGLLYHFGSRDALADGLLDRLAAAGTLDVELMRAAEDGASSYYIRTSVIGESIMDKSIVAALRLGAEYQDRVQALFHSLQDSWYQLLLAEVEDPAVARAILLMGDGLYYNQSLYGQGIGADAASRVSQQEQVDQLLDVVARLRRCSQP